MATSIEQIFSRGLFSARIVRSTATYATADVINKGIPFILLPVLARYLSTADYGVLTNFNVLTQILGALCALNTYSALSVSYFNTDDGGMPDLLSNLLYLVAMLAAACLVLCTVFAGTITHYLAISRTWQLLALLTACATAVSTLYLSLLRMQMRPVRFSAIQLGQSLTSSALAVAFVVSLKWNWQGRVLSITVAAVLTALVCLWWFWRSEHLFTPLRRDQIRNAFSFGLPLLPHTMSFWIKTGMVKIVITNTLGLSANGIYAIALTLGSAVGVFTDAFFSAYAPTMYKDLAELGNAPALEGDQIRRRLVKNTYAFAAVLALVCVCGWLAMRVVIPLLFRGDYLQAVRLIPLVFVALFFDGLYTIVSGYVFYRRKTKILGAITFSSSVLQVVVTLVLIKPLGLYGALYGGCFVSLLTFLAVLAVANRLYDLPWRLAPNV